MENKLMEFLSIEYTFVGNKYIYIGKVDESGKVKFLDHKGTFSPTTTDSYYNSEDSPKKYNFSEISILTKDLFDEDEIVVLYNIVEDSIIITDVEKIQEAYTQYEEQNY